MHKLDNLYRQWLSLQPLSTEDNERLDRLFMLEFNYNSNHIEGNTLTYGQTELLLILGETVDGANTKDIEEMKAHNVGLELVKLEAMDRGKPLTETFIRQLHQTILRKDYTVNRVLPDGERTSYTIHAGRYKTRPNSVITIHGEPFAYASPEETPALMKDLVQWYNEVENKGNMTPAELSALFHYRYVRIHPFEDGNGRIARLLANFILLRHNYPMIVVRSKFKNEYLKALSQCDLLVGAISTDGAKASLVQIAPFVRYTENLLMDKMSKDIRLIKEKSDEIWWYDGDFVTFTSPNTGKMLNLMIASPKITVREMADTLGINKSAVQKQLKTLQLKGYLQRVAGLRGYWHVSIVCTTFSGGTNNRI